MQNKIVRSICYFAKQLNPDVFDRLADVQNTLLANGYTVQTRRICVAETPLESIAALNEDPSIFFGRGGFDRNSLAKALDGFMRVRNVTIHLDLTAGVQASDVATLFDIIQRAPENTFNFGYLFNAPASSPFFPCAKHEEDGVAIGLQATDLAEGCESVAQWLARMRDLWADLDALLGDRTDFLGIDSSVAPMFHGDSSLIHLMKRIYGSFTQSVTTDAYLQITDFIRRHNPRPVGLCGLMLPCLEDFELAEEYAMGNFSVERNLFLALHSGLGIDTYPIGIDESPQRVLEILTLVHGLSTKYNKPMMARFVSDGKARIGEKTDFANQFLQDVVVRPL